MEQLIKFCIKSSEEDFFKYLMLAVVSDKQQQKIKNLLDKYDSRTSISEME